MATANRPLKPATFAAVRCESSSIVLVVISCPPLDGRDHSRRWFLWWLIFRAPDQQPEERQFPNSKNHSEISNTLRERGQKKRDRGADHVAAARNDRSDTDKARDKIRSHHSDAEGKEPKAPEDLGQDKPLAVQPEEKQDESVEL